MSFSSFKNQLAGLQVKLMLLTMPFRGMQFFVLQTICIEELLHICTLLCYTSLLK